MTQRYARTYGANQHLADQTHWVYAIHHVASGNCVYVGMTCNLRRRLNEHGRQRLWREPAFSFTSTEVAGREQAEWAELEWMRRLRPSANCYPYSLSSIYGGRS